MANCSLLWDKASDRGTISSGSWVGGLPATNFQEADVQKVARSTNAATSSTKFRIDLGTAKPEPLSSFAMLNHNGTTVSQWRIVVTSDSTDADPLQRVLDTGLMNMWVPTVVFGALPWGAYPWDGIDTSAYPSGVLAYYALPDVVLGRYIWVYISDAANPAGYFQAGRFLAGVAWTPSTNYSEGATIKYNDPSVIKRTRGGKRLTLVRPSFRQISIKFDYLTKEEAFGIAFEVERQLGKTGNFLLVMDPDEAGNFRFRRTIYGALEDMDVIQTPSEDIWQWAISGEECS